MSEQQQETQEQIKERIKADLAKLTDQSALNEVDAAFASTNDDRKLKINLIVIEEDGSIKYMNNSTNPNTEIAGNTIFDKKARYAQVITLRMKALTEDKIFLVSPWIFNMLGRFGYEITNRDKNVNAQDATKVTHIFTLTKIN